MCNGMSVIAFGSIRPLALEGLRGSYHKCSSYSILTAAVLAPLGTESG